MTSRQDPDPTKDEDNRIHVRLDLRKDRPPEPNVLVSVLGFKGIFYLVIGGFVLLCVVLVWLMEMLGIRF